MKKKLLAMLLASAMVLSTACNGGDAPQQTTSGGEGSQTTQGGTDAPVTEPTFGEQGKVFNIYAWNEEFKGFFEKYFAGTKPINSDAVENEGAEPIYFDKAPGIPDGITVNWILNPSDGGVYQDKLDEALLNQANTAADDKIDMFLAEADYILKYVDADATMDISKLGLKHWILNISIQLTQLPTPTALLRVYPSNAAPLL